MDPIRLQVALLLALCGLEVSLQAAAGTAGADILLSRLGGRPEGMAEAYTGIGDDLAATLYNPAALQALPDPSISFSHFAAIDQITYENLDYAQPFDWGTVGLDFVLRDQPPINNPLATDNPVTVQDLVLTATYAQKPSYFLKSGLPEVVMDSSIGINVKWVRSQLGPATANDGAVDIASKTDLGSGRSLGIAILNLGPPIYYIDQDQADPLPQSYNLGIGQHWEITKSNTANLDVDLQYPLYSNASLHVGAEDWIGKSLALRVGYAFGSSNDTEGLTAGLTIRLDQDTLRFGVDYAYVPVYFDGFNSYEVQNLFSLNLGF